MNLPEPLQNLVNALTRLPGIGPKTAARLTFYLLNAPEEISRDLATALLALKERIGYCRVCYNITLKEQPECEICADPQRDGRILCVVEEPLDVLAIERTGAYTGKYHVLRGALSPIEGIGPEDLTIRELLMRLQAGGIEEIILATNPSLEGDATAMYIQRQLAGTSVRITRLARGLPVGGDLEYADQNTLLRALQGRQNMQER